MQYHNLSEQLSNSSTPYDDPLATVRWQDLNKSQFWLPESAISLFGTSQYQSLSLEQKQRLSQAEFINFIEAGLWLESLFMERIGRSVRQDRSQLNEVIYHLHEMREEAGHSLMFLELIQRSGLNIPHQHFNQLSFANLFAKHAPFNGAMFWLAVLVGEEVPDRMNRFIRKNRDQVCHTVVDIVSIHIHDEARHIAHAKSMIEEKLACLPAWQLSIRSLMINKMFRDFVNAYYYPPNSIYQAAGLDKKTNWEAIARNNSQRNNFVQESIIGTVDTIRARGINLVWSAS